MSPRAQLVIPGFTKTSCGQPSLETATDRHHHGVDERIGRVHGRRLAVSLSDCDGSVRSIVLRVHLGSDGEDLFVHVHVEKTKSTSCSGNLLSIVVVLTFLTSSSRCKLLKEDLRILQGSIYLYIVTVLR